jgi:hypothetical protein
MSKSSRSTPKRTRIFLNGFIRCNTWEATYGIFQPKSANTKQIFMMSHAKQNPLPATV